MLITTLMRMDNEKRYKKYHFIFLRKKDLITNEYGKLVADLHSAVKSKEKLFNPCMMIKIILADDEIISRSAVQSMIESSEKYHVFAFSNGIEVCNCYEENNEEIDIIILDIEMPERNGIDTAIWIRQYEKDHGKNNIPIIGLSGHEEEDVKSACLSAGMNEIFSKPLSKNKLCTAIERYSIKRILNI